MFGEAASFGFVPGPNLALQAGHLYNVVISLLVALGCGFAAWAIFSRGKKGLAEKTIALFLALVALYWSGSVISNLLGWFGLLAWAKAWAYIVKLKLVLPPIILAYFFSRELTADKTIERLITYAYIFIALVFLLITYQVDATMYKLSYWGVHWQVDNLSKFVYIAGLLLPLSLLAFGAIIKRGLKAAQQGTTANYTLYFGGIIFILLEYLQITFDEVTWQSLLARLLYILIAFGAYLVLVGRLAENRFVPRQQTVAARPRLRLPFFVKLLLLFVSLAVLPITIACLLMFVSFKEIIDLYIQKPLLWNLKTSREAFLAALNHVQIQSVFLTLVTGLLVFVVSLLVAKAIAASLATIAQGMSRVSRGDFGFKILPASNDEIGDVVNYFNNMSTEIKRSREIMENWNKELEAKVAERTEDLQALYNVSEAIGSSLDFDLLIERAVAKLLPVVKADIYAVLVPDKQGQYITRLSHGLNLNGIRLANDRGVLGQVLQQKKVCAAHNELGLKHLLLSPLRVKGKTLGVLILGTQASGTNFAERETRLLATISEQLAVAVENVGIYEKEKEAVARLTELDRLKNEFISMVSHELRTPVTSVDGYISLFLAGVTGELSPDQKKYLTIMQENDQRLLTLINRLLDFSKIESGRFSVKKELVSITDIINEALEVFNPQLVKRGLPVRLELQAHDVNFMGDREKMIEVFINLLENALKFSAEGREPKIVITTRDAGDFIRVEIADNGIGLDKSQLAMIFNKFYQAEDTMTRKVGGVGLGLAIVKETIGNHGGRIWAESAGKGRGATFIITLPLAEKV